MLGTQQNHPFFIMLQNLFTYNKCYDKLKEYGYDDSINFNDFSGDFEEDEWESEYDEDEFSIDGDVLLEFLREYYLVEGDLPGEEYL